MTPHQPPKGFQPERGVTVACAFEQHTECSGRIAAANMPRTVRPQPCLCACHQRGVTTPLVVLEPTLPGFGIHREH